MKILKYRVCPYCGKEITFTHGNTKHCKDCGLLYRKTCLKRRYILRRLSYLFERKGHYKQKQRALSKLYQLNGDSTAEKICELCGTPHHKECWEENKGCTTYGCSNNPNTDSKGEITFGSIDIGNQTIAEIKRDLETERKKVKDTINCPKCNIPINKNSYFCNHCGFYMKEDTSKKGTEQFEKEYQKRYKEKAG